MILRVLNLGAGVQSTTIYLMMIRGMIESCDMAIFADTGDEPLAVYQHVEFLKTLKGPQIITVSNGNLGDNLVDGTNSTGQRFVSIPAFLSMDDNGSNDGIGRRQCTSEYKIIPIEKEIRRILGIKPGCRLAKDDRVTQIFGLSFDEPKRVVRVRDLYDGRKQWDAEFPLFEEFITRPECESWLKKEYPDVDVPRSACVFCPYRSDEEWLRLKQNDPEGFARAVKIDEAIRNPNSARTKGLEAKQYLHRSCQPLVQIEFKPAEPSDQRKMSFSQLGECEGFCGH